MPSSVDCEAGEEPNGTKCKNKCRVALVGAQRMRVAKVASMLLSVSPDVVIVVPYTLVIKNMTSLPRD